MVNEPGKLTGEERVRKDQPSPSQFAIQKGGEEEETYEQLLDQYGGRKFAQGDVMKGTVLKITDTDVIVDIGYKSEGIIPVNQFIEPNGVLAVAIGDVIDVLLEDTEDYDGHIVL
ncbi:MAG TPA: S1 RNA-binding domain-containing protein, partial [Terriglobia bacterium]|nr:S1 RNA-binding domain-containing protein [Terriglobia bacterium]